MRPPLLSAVLTAALLAGAPPALAEDADCGLLCRINGYLATDHMTAAPDDAGSASPGASKTHKAHAARKPAPKSLAAAPMTPAPVKAGTPAAVIAASAKAVAGTVAPAEARPRVAATKTIPAAPKPAMAVVTKAPSAPHAAGKQPGTPVRPEVVATAPRAAEHPRPAARPAPVLAAAPTAPAAVRAVHHRVARAVPAPTGASQTATASAFIPGSAPTMGAGFHPFAVQSLR